MAFTAAQKTQINRLPADYFRNPVESGMTAQQFRSHVSKKLEKYTPDQLRARVNILGVSDKVNWSAENDYTSEEQAYIEAAMPRNKWRIAVPLILAEAAALEADGASVVLIKSILKSR